MDRSLLAAIFLLSGCAAVHPVSRDATMVLKARIDSGALTQAEVPVYSKALVHHLKLKLYNLTAGDQDTGIIRTLLNAQLDNPLVIGNLRPNTSYRVRAYAYFSSDDSQLISTPDSFADIPVLSDDRPTMGNLSVQLIDRPFSAQASPSGLTFTEGGYLPVGSEQMQYLGLEGIVSTLAGNGTAGVADGTGTQAMFSAPCGITMDSKGNLFVVDRGTHRIRKVTRQGVVSTFAGSGTSGSLDGTGTVAQFNDPYGIAIDQADNLYVAEVSACRIRKITKDGVVSVWAGSGEGASQDGTGTAAKVNRPHGIVVSPAGEVYFSEGWGYVPRIRKITTDRVVTTVAGGTSAGWRDGTGSEALFNNLAGLVFDKSGNLIIADYTNHRLRRMTPAGVVTTFVGSGVSGNRDGYGTLAQIDSPGNLVFDKDENLYLTSGSNYPDYCIKKVSPSGLVTTLAGLGSGTADGTGRAASFARAEGIVYDSTGAIYITDRFNNRIRILQ